MRPLEASAPGGLGESRETGCEGRRLAHRRRRRRRARPYPGTELNCRKPPPAGVPWIPPRPSERTVQAPDPRPSRTVAADGLIHLGLRQLGPAGKQQTAHWAARIILPHNWGPWGRQGSLRTLGGRVGLEEGRQEEPHGAQHTHNHEHPQEQPVDHHGHVLPVLHDLRADRGGARESVLGSPLRPSCAPRWALTIWLEPHRPQATQNVCASARRSRPPTPAASQSHLATWAGRKAEVCDRKPNLIGNKGTRPKNHKFFLLFSLQVS